MYTPTAANVLSVYRRADSDMLSAGLSWYDDANQFSATLDHLHRAAGVVAALSPMNSWPTNKAGATKVYAQGYARGTHTLNNERKADLILNGEDAFDVLGGNKVRAFYLAIVEPHNPNSTPVIDRHAFDIAVGVSTNDKARSILSRKGVYQEFAEFYREAARIAGIGVHQMQAVTWMQWRKEKGIVD